MLNHGVESCKKFRDSHTQNFCAQAMPVLEHPRYDNVFRENSYHYAYIDLAAGYHSVLGGPMVPSTCVFVDEDDVRDLEDLI